jgi:hypothetical protein
MRLKAIHFTHTFFHATEKANVPYILTRGLLVSERGTNPLGLDYELDYSELYNSSDAPQHIKPPCIHLTEDYENVKKFQQIIQQSFEQPAFILKVVIDSVKDVLRRDTEDNDSYICLNDIESERISLTDDQDSLVDENNDPMEEDDLQMGVRI